MAAFILKHSHKNLLGSWIIVEDKMRQKCYKILLIVITVMLFSRLVGIGHMERKATGIVSCI